MDEPGPSADSGTFSSPKHKRIKRNPMNAAEKTIMMNINKHVQETWPKDAYPYKILQVKKSNRWQCKMCNEKQSMKRRYGLGTGKECRVHVQKLNSLRGKIDATKENYYSLSYDEDEEDDLVVESTSKTNPDKSKWSGFVSMEESKHEDEPADSKMYLNDVEVVLETPKKGCKRKFGKISSNENSYKKLKKQTWERNNISNKEENEDCFKEPEALSNMDTTGVADIKPKPKIKFVSPKFTRNIQKSSIQAPKWDDFTVGHVDSDPGVMYLDSQYPYTGLGDQSQPKNTLPTNYNSDSKVVKSSKWAQYVSDEKESVEINELRISKQETLSKEKLLNIFSLCDNNELDDVLVL